jgi:replicative DNA helicase
MSETRQGIEQAILGSMVLLQDAAEFAAGELSETDFQNPAMRAMFQAVCAMVETDTPIDAVTMAEELIRRGDLERAGGVAGVAAVMDAVPHAANCRFYIGKLNDLNQRDRLKALGERLRIRAEDPTIEPSDTIEAIRGELEAIAGGDSETSDIITAAEALAAYDARTNDDRTVLPTGLGELDRLLNGGLRGGQLIVTGGRPGLGKSALMEQVVLHTASQFRPALMASLEMTSGELAGRALRTISRQRFAELPMVFAECCSFTKLQSVLRLAKRRHQIELAAVDYLQLIESPTGKNELRERQVAAMSRGLKQLAMELKIPILLGSQLNRESEKRGRPIVADLRESGAIEQDADIIILIHGDDGEDGRELIVGKHRGGPQGIVNATFDRPRFKFSTEPWTGKL